MPRPRRTKVAPSAPTAVPFLERERALKAAAAAKQDDAVILKTNTSKRNTRLSNQPDPLMSGALSNEKHSFSFLNHDDDLYGVSDKENSQAARIPSSMPDETTTTASLAISKIRGTPQTRTRMGSQLSSAIRHRAQATPRGLAESSMLSLGDFKRRSRQPSLLGIGCADDTPSLSSLGGDLSVDLDRDHDDDLADFQPVDESTPAHPRREQLRPFREPHASSTPAASQQTGRKRKIISVEVDVPASIPRASSEDSLATLATLDIPATAMGSGEPELPSPKRRAVTPPADSTMAPPQSSPSPSEAEHPTRAVRSARPTRSQTAREQMRAQPLSTAALQSLLPRRRNRPASRTGAYVDVTDELPSSPTQTADDDDDELSFAPGRRHRLHTNARRTASAAAMKVLRPTTKQGRRKASQASQGRELTSLRAVKRTYGRRSQGEETTNDSLIAADEDEAVEENTDLTTEIQPKRDSDISPATKRRMERVAAKFKEIDEWEMEFEDVSGGISSPGGGR